MFVGLQINCKTKLAIQWKWIKEYVTFLHKPDKKFFNFEDVKSEIEAETNCDPGPTGFSSKPISLKVFAPNVLKLTLVDLPGLIECVVGDQSESSIEDIRKMVFDYIAQPNCLIVAVSPANQDIANSVALKSAKEVDPRRERTIGVLTKLDLMDAGTNALEVLENKKIRLQRGYVGVLNRSQKDIEDGRDIQYCLEKERNFFQTNPVYKQMSEKMGTPYLQKVLHQQLRAHIKHCLPSVSKELSQKLNSIRKQIKEGDELVGNIPKEADRLQFYVIRLAQQFIDDVTVKLFGQSVLVDRSAISLGALINYKLYTELQEMLKVPIILNEEELMILIANMHGIRNILSVPSLSLEAVCGELLFKYKEPLESFVDKISEVICNAVVESSDTIGEYPRLKDKLLCTMRKLIDEAADRTKEALMRHLNAEMFYVNLYHADMDTHEIKKGELPSSPVKVWTTSKSCFKGGDCDSCDSSGENLIESEEKAVLDKMMTNENAKANCQVLTDLVQKYMLIQQKQIGDTAIKYIVYFLIKRVSDFMRTSLVATLLQTARTESFMDEIERELQVQERAREMCLLLEDALHAIYSF